MIRRRAAREAAVRARAASRPDGRNVFERHRVLTLAIFVSALLLAIDFGAGAVLGERSIRQPHGFYHHGLVPLAAGFEHFGGKRARYFTNSLAMRDVSRREVALAKGSRRILVLGDSFAEGVGFRYPRSAVGLVAAQLPEAEVLNAAVVSHSPRLSYLRLLHLADVIGLEFDDVVLFVDISDVQDEVLYERFEPHEIPSDVWRAYRARRLLREWSFAGGQLMRLRQSTDTAAWFDEGVFPQLHESYGVSKTPRFWSLRASWPSATSPRPEWIGRGIRLQRESLLRIIDFCRERGHPLTFVAYPWPPQLGPAGLTGDHIDPLRELAREHDVALVDLYPVFARQGSPGRVTKLLFIAGDVHWNRAGNELVAEHVARALRER